jgi:hypothetical protein
VVDTIEPSALSHLPSQHGCDRLRIERPAALVEMALRRQRRPDLAKRPLPALGFPERERLRNLDDLGPQLGMALRPSTLAPVARSTHQVLRRPVAFSVLPTC